MRIGEDAQERFHVPAFVVVDVKKVLRTAPKKLHDQVVARLADERIAAHKGRIANDPQLLAARDRRQERNLIFKARHAAERRRADKHMRRSRDARGRKALFDSFYSDSANQLHANSLKNPRAIEGVLARGVAKSYGVPPVIAPSATKALRSSLPCALPLTTLLATWVE